MTDNNIKQYDIQRAEKKVADRIVKLKKKSTYRPPITPTHPLQPAATLINEEVAAQLKAIRKEECMSIKQFAEVLDTFAPFISKTENQDRRLDVGEFIQYCRGAKRDPIAVLKALI